MPVTPEAAGSSPVDPAKPKPKRLKHLARLNVVHVGTVFACHAIMEIPLLRCKRALTATANDERRVSRSRSDTTSIAEGVTQRVTLRPIDEVEWSDAFMVLRNFERGETLRLPVRRCCGPPSPR